MPMLTTAAGVPSSSYRLGDLFWGNLPGTSRLSVACELPTSIGAEYLRFAMHKFDAATLAQAASTVCQPCTPLKGIKESVAVHLRVGDVACGYAPAEWTKRPFPAEVYRNLSVSWQPTRHVYVFAAQHYSAASTYHCEDISTAYVNSVLQAINGTLAPKSSVDCDLCSMANAMTFVRGQGCFSATVAALRLYHGRTSTRVPGLKEHHFCNTTKLGAAISKGTSSSNSSNSSRGSEPRHHNQVSILNVSGRTPRQFGCAKLKTAAKWSNHQSSQSIVY